MFRKKIPHSAIFLAIKSFFVYLIAFHTSVFAISTLTLKNGSILRGTIKAQDELSVTFQTLEGSVSTIKKTEILKILFKDPKPKEEEKPVIEAKSKEEQAPLPPLVGPEPKKVEDIPGKLDLKKPSAFTSYELTEAFEKGELTLALPTDTCQEFSRSHDWYWLFGTLPLSRPDLSKLLPNDKKRIRIRSMATGTDVALSFFGAIMTSITRKTLVVDVCEPEKPSPSLAPGTVKGKGK